MCLVFKVADYQKHALECRELAAKARSPHVRDELPKMAAVWSELADDRERKLDERRLPKAAP